MGVVSNALARARCRQRNELIEMAPRRLAYQRTWFLIVLGVGAFAVSLGTVIFVALEMDWQKAWGEDDLAVPVLLVPLSLPIIARGWTGSWAKRQLRVDVAAGVFVLPNGDVHKLDELGALSLVKVPYKFARPVTMRAAPNLSTYELRAGACNYVLFKSFEESETKLRYEALDAAVLQYRLRRVLERPQVDGAYRAGTDQLAEILQVAGSDARAVRGLRVLGCDHDSTIRETATKLIALVSNRRPAA